MEEKPINIKPGNLIDNHVDNNTTISDQCHGLTPFEKINFTDLFFKIISLCAISLTSNNRTPKNNQLFS